MFLPYLFLASLEIKKSLIKVNWWFIVVLIDGHSIRKPQSIQYSTLSCSKTRQSRDWVADNRGYLCSLSTLSRKSNFQCCDTSSVVDTSKFIKPVISESRSKPIKQSKIFEKESASENVHQKGEFNRTNFHPTQPHNSNSKNSNQSLSLFHKFFLENSQDYSSIKHTKPRQLPNASANRYNLTKDDTFSPKNSIDSKNVETNPIHQYYNWMPMHGTSTRWACFRCNTELCCDVYEACISCCLHPYWVNNSLLFLFSFFLSKYKVSILGLDQKCGDNFPVQDVFIEFTINYHFLFSLSQHILIYIFGLYSTL